jgi:predicted  nucleic acid-binding Zn-ribbon protein
MTIEETVRALAELSDIDLRLSSAGSQEDRVSPSLEGRRAALRKAIPGNMLAAYDDLARAGRRPAVVPIVRGSYCGGCYMRVPPQLHAFVRRGQSVCSCTRCRRLLYFAAPTAESERGNGSELHGAGAPVPGRGPSPRKRPPSRAPVGKRKVRPS